MKAMKTMKSNNYLSSLISFNKSDNFKLIDWFKMFVNKKLFEIKETRNKKSCNVTKRDSYFNRIRIVSELYYVIRLHIDEVMKSIKFDFVVRDSMMKFIIIVFKKIEEFKQSINENHHLYTPFGETERKIVRICMEQMDLAIPVVSKYIQRRSKRISKLPPVCYKELEENEF